MAAVHCGNDRTSAFDGKAATIAVGRYVLADLFAIKRL